MEPTYFVSLAILQCLLPKHFFLLRKCSKKLTTSSLFVTVLLYLHTYQLLHQANEPTQKYLSCPLERDEGNILLYWYYTFLFHACLCVFLFPGEHATLDLFGVFWIKVLIVSPSSDWVSLMIIKAEQLCKVNDYCLQWDKIFVIPYSVVSVSRDWFLFPSYSRILEIWILKRTRKIFALRAAFSSSCGGLQPLTAMVGPFGPNNGALRAKPKIIF